MPDMSKPKPYLMVLEEIECVGISGLGEVLREEGIVAVRYVLCYRPRARETCCKKSGKKT